MPLPCHRLVSSSMITSLSGPRLNRPYACSISNAPFSVFSLRYLRFALFLYRLLLCSPVVFRLSSPLHHANHLFQAQRSLVVSHPLERRNFRLVSVRPTFRVASCCTGSPSGPIARRSFLMASHPGHPYPISNLLTFVVSGCCFFIIF